MLGLCTKDLVQSTTTVFYCLMFSDVVMKWNSVAHATAMCLTWTAQEESNETEQVCLTVKVFLARRIYCDTSLHAIMGLGPKLISIL